MATKRKADRRTDKAKCYFRELDLGKRHYKRADAILDELALELEPGEEIPLSEHNKAVFKDKGARFFHGSYARRYELELVKA